MERASVSAESVMAMSVLRAASVAQPIEISDISRVLYDLEDRGYDLGQIALRRVPGGLYSEDVEAFVGRLLAAGYAKARSPIQVFSEGIRICSLILQDEFSENPDGLKAVASELKFNLSGVIDQGLQLQPR